MSRSARPSPRRPRLAVVAVALALIALFGACSHQRQVPDRYGETTEKNFTEGCIDTLTQNGPEPEGASESDLGGSEAFSAERARAVCTCSYEGISGDEGISYERFKEITEAQEEEPGPLPDEMQAIISGCVEANQT